MLLLLLLLLLLLHQPDPLLCACFELCQQTPSTDRWRRDSSSITRCSIATTACSRSARSVLRPLGLLTCFGLQLR